jgi:hypothetical protein
LIKHARYGLLLAAEKPGVGRAIQRQVFEKPCHGAPVALVPAARRLQTDPLSRWRREPWAVRPRVAPTRRRARYASCGESLGKELNPLCR